MKNPLRYGLRLYPLFILLVCGWPIRSLSEPLRVRHASGTIHGFLELRSQDGNLAASGEVIQVAHGNHVTLRIDFTFTDGSVDNETAVFSQRGSFHLLTDRHVQKGPFFPHPMDVSIDVTSGQVTVRTTGKDGKDWVKVDHLNLPSDLANGMIPQVFENILPNSQLTEVSMLVANPKPRLVKLDISSVGEEPFSVAGIARKSVHYSMKIKLGGVAGIAAPLIGKQPPNVEVWITQGEAPTFIREQGPIYPEGPIMTIQLASPVWPNSRKRSS